MTSHSVRMLFLSTSIVALSLSAVTAAAQESASAHPDGEWPLVGGDWSSSRHSTLDQISTATIGRLGGAWVREFDGGAASRATPVMADGTLYLTAGANVFALDARTGDTRWRWQTPEDRPQMVPSWQGVGLSDELLFVGLRTSEVAAIDRDTGELVWATAIGTVPQEIGEMVTTAPMYARGRVYAGVASGDSGGQGRIVALDAESGEIDWTFFIVPRPGEFGHDTWPQDSNTWQMGGGGVWLVGTVDPDLGLVYFATGNPVPMFGGEIRAGDNLFTASVVAVDTETGELRWHYQVVRHDVWDADIATPLLLYETQVDGQPRKALAAMRADGFLFLFDRETGEPLLPIEQRPVPQDPGQLTAATQPFPIGAESILPDCAYWRDRVPPPFQLNCSGFTPPTVDAHTVVAPGAPIPRVRVTPMSHSPQTGFIYAQGVAHVGRIRRFADPWLVNTGDVQITLPDALGIIAAVDTATGRVVWKHEVPTRFLGTSGPLTTAGGLMFRAAPDGLVEAYDARTGDRAWTFQTAPAGALMRPGPAITYELDGRQYVSVAMGREFWAFALDGAVEPRGEPLTDLWAGVPPRGPRPEETQEIETGTLLESPAWAVGGRRYALEEHRFNPVRARVRAGVRVRFLNSGEIPHTIAARDGSWSTETLDPATWGFVTFDEPGTFLFHCVEHPWAIGELTVEP